MPTISYKVWVMGDGKEREMGYAGGRDGQGIHSVEAVDGSCKPQEA